MLRQYRRDGCRPRAAGALIVHAPITLTEDYHELSAEDLWYPEGRVDTKSFRQRQLGRRDVEVHWRPQSGDIVVEGKVSSAASASTNLDFILAAGITDVALAGFLTNCCVRSTMRSRL